MRIIFSKDCIYCKEKIKIELYGLNLNFIHIYEEHLLPLDRNTYMADNCDLIVIILF